jgi:hypothetical protein
LGGLYNKRHINFSSSVSGSQFTSEHFNNSFKVFLSTTLEAVSHSDQNTTINLTRSIVWGNYKIIFRQDFAFQNIGFKAYLSNTHYFYKFRLIKPCPCSPRSFSVIFSPTISIIFHIGREGYVQKMQQYTKFVEQSNILKGY